ncbi:MAG: tRNA pseudouridine(38-40) synthase TruA [Clostridiales bacterium]|nr:tRNA pseudouridine(38-40) synthase TruA [Clostridiales bacterium]
MQRNILLTISFDGSAYHGWQVQSNACTVQQVLCDAIKSVTGAFCPVTGCSRTDTGVHANMFCCCVKTESAISTQSLPAALNANLPDDIVVLSAREMPAEFHARYDCRGKEYVYKIFNSELRSPFLVNRALLYKYPLDAEFLDVQARAFLGTHDFSSFCASGSSVENKIRTVSRVGVAREGDIVTFTVAADGFLYNMVRIMVGTLLDISSGKLGADSIPSVISACNRSAAGVTAPAQGLYLNRVFYDFNLGESNNAAGSQK